MTPFIVCKQVVKAYKVDDHELVALRGIDFEMEKGEMVSIIGSSGAGKSSLLNLLGGLDTPTAGQLTVDGQNLLNMKGRKLADYRLRKVGFVWQNVSRNLLPNCSALRNVTLPMMMAGVSPWQRGKQGRELLEAVGLSDKANQRPAALSGGQQQRVAIAVALANQPVLLLADEPTGALDRQSAAQVVELLQALRKRYGLTILLVTHDLEVAANADRVLTLRDGALGQDMSKMGDDSPRMDEAGSIKLPETVRSVLSDASHISVEIRPEGILLRPESETDEVMTMGDTLMDAPPAPKRRFGWLRRKTCPKGAVMTEYLIEAHGIERTFGTAANPVRVLRGLDICVESGTLVALYGPSGSGKTTLLNLIGALDRPNAGTILLNGQDIVKMGDGKRAKLRRTQIGFIFQSDTLLPTYSALENIDLALRLPRLGIFERRRRAQSALQAVSLTTWASHVPDELSGGQRQRVSIARALALHAKIILADEPTSGLDTRTARHILTLFRNIAHEQGTTLFIVSHDPIVVDYVDQAYDLVDGRLAARPVATRS